MENLLISWQEFLRGKRNRKDVAEFSLNLIDNILALHVDLKSKTYQHGKYQAFKINDPKPRDIHKASVRDRLVHHAICRILYPHFDRKFVFDSYSCRLDKGTHRAINRFRNFSRLVSQNNTRTVWVLQCDIKKFFANIDHQILFQILAKCIADRDILWLLEKIVSSFSTESKVNVGLPLGNLTSQLLINVYMHEFDWFVKHKLKVKHYLRYADDFVVLHHSRPHLINLIYKMSDFLKDELKLALNTKKLFVKTLDSGVDFLGWVHFLEFRILRTTTKHRMFTRLKQNHSSQTAASYLGLISHGDTCKLVKRINDQLLERLRLHPDPRTAHTYEPFWD